MPFKPGQSGNPAGRPPGSRNRVTIAREQLDRILALADRLQAMAPAETAAFWREVQRTETSAGSERQPAAKSPSAWPLPAGK